MSGADGLGYSIGDLYSITAHGEVAGNTGATAMPSVSGKWAKFKAKSDNPTFVYIGLAGVTKSAGTTTTTGGWELDGGQETDWLPIPGGNLSGFYYICTAAGDDFSYLVMA